MRASVSSAIASKDKPRNPAGLGQRLGRMGWLQR